MSLAILFVDEMHIVGAHKFDAEFLGETHQHLVHLHLSRIHIMIGTGHGGLVALEFEVVIFAPDAFEP